MLTYRLPDELLGGHVLMSYSKNPISTVGMVFDQSGNLVPKQDSYAASRRREYPPVTEQLDAIWHAMNNGEIPKVPGFYDPIAEVKDKYPKGSN